MNRVWNILNSRHASREMLYWAADSKIGAACAIATWIASHVVCGLAAATGWGSFYDRHRAPVMFWIEVGFLALCLCVIDIGIVVCLIRDLRNKRRNQSLDPTRWTQP